MRLLSRLPKSAKRARLHVEPLEDRTVPATIASLNGTLTVSAIHNGTLTVTQNNAGNFTVTDGTTNNGTFAVTNGIDFELGAKTVQATLVMAEGAGVLHGNFTVNSGNSLSIIQIQGNTSSTPSILGNVVINAGWGNVVGINSGDAGNELLNVSGDTTVNSKYGNTPVFMGVAVKAGAADNTLGGTVTTLRGNVNLHGVTTYTLGSTNFTTGTTVRGNFNADMQQSGTSTATVNAASTYLFTGLSSVRGTFAITNLVNNLTVTLRGTSGATTLTAGPATNSFLLAGTVNGSLKVSAGAGVNSFMLDTNLKVVGVTSDLVITVGGGTNGYFFDDTFTVGRNFILNGQLDNNNDSITFDGTAGGSVQLTLGGGDNTINFDSANTYDYTAGTGANNLTVNTAALTGLFDMIIFCNGGSNTLTLNGSGFVTGTRTAGFAGNTFVNNLTPSSHNTMTNPDGNW